MADKKKPSVLPWGMHKETLQPNSVKVRERISIYSIHLMGTITYRAFLSPK